MTAPQMLSNHSKMRDEYGLPLVRNTTRLGLAGSDYDPQTIAAWNRIHVELHGRSKEIRGCIKEIEFIMKCLVLPTPSHDYLITYSLAGKKIDTFNDKAISEETDLMKRMAQEVTIRKGRLRLALAVILDHMVDAIPDKLSPVRIKDFVRPSQGYLRVFGPQSHTKYEPRLGFLCSSWQKCEPAANLEVLMQKGILSVPSLRSHCENDPRGSDWISLSSDASWMLAYIDNHWPEGSASVNSMSIALVSAAKMERLGLPFDRSDLLVRTAGGAAYSRKNPDGIKFTSHRHCLVYRWIPVQCIVRVFSLANFRRACKDRSIKPGWFLPSNHLSNSPC